MSNDPLNRPWLAVKDNMKRQGWYCAFLGHDDDTVGIGADCRVVCRNCGRVEQVWV